MNPAGGQRGEADVGGVGAECLDLPVARIRPGTDDSSQGGAQQIAVMPVGPADGERQRDATGVHQKTALAPIFSLYRWSWVPRILAPAVLCSWPHPRSANAKRCPPFRRTRPGRPSISSGKSLPAASAGSGHARHWRCRTPWAAPSTGSRCEAHRQSPKKPASLASACVPLRVCAGTCGHATAFALGPAAQACSTTRPTLSKT